MAGDLRVSLKLTAEDLLSPQIVEALSKLQMLEQQTARLNGTGAMGPAPERAARGLAAAETEAAAAAGLLAGASEHAAGAVHAMSHSWLGGMLEMVAGVVAFEAVLGTFDKVIEAARDMEQANRQLTARFGESAGEYAEFSEQVSSSTNFTAVAFERAASTLQPLMRDYDLTDEQLKGLLATTADLAAANSIGLVQAATDVAAVMRGQVRAGAELGLNLRTNVIASMDGLTAAEKEAVAAGDTFGGAQARLKVVNIEAAGSLGMAAKAAGESGDQFARLSGATAKMYEVMAESSPVAGLAGDLATAATSATNLLLIFERVNELQREGETGGSTGIAVRAYEELFGAVTSPGHLGMAAAAGLVAFNLADQEEAARMRGAAGYLPVRGGGTRWELSSGGMPDPHVIEAQTRAVNQLALAEQRAGEREVALGRERRLTEEQYATAVTGVLATADSALKRHTDGIHTVAGAWAQVLDGVSKVADAQLKAAQGGESALESTAAALRADRARRRRLGEPELEGESALIRRLGAAEFGQQGKVGVAAMSAAEALLAKLANGEDPLGLGKVQVERQEVTAGTVVVNGPMQGGGGQSSISGSGRPAGGRYDRSRGPWDPASMGIGRAIG